jgi:hypothetical protein
MSKLPDNITKFLEHLKLGQDAQLINEIRTNFVKLSLLIQSELNTKIQKILESEQAIMTELSKYGFTKQIENGFLLQLHILQAHAVKTAVVDMMIEKKVVTKPNIDTLVGALERNISDTNKVFASRTSMVPPIKGQPRGSSQKKSKKEKYLLYGGAESTRPSLDKDAKHLYLKYDHQQADDLRTSIFYKKYLLYKQKYIKLKQLLGL